MDLDEHARRLVARIDVLRDPCDLDLLIFFARHPRTLMASEHLGAFLGYGVKEIAASLDLLMAAGLLTRTPNPRHAARMYVFAVDGSGGGWLPALLKLAATRQGRLELIWALRRRRSERPGDPVPRVEPKGTLGYPRPFLVARVRTEPHEVERTSDDAPGSESRQPRKGGGHSGRKA